MKIVAKIINKDRTSSTVKIPQGVSTFGHKGRDYMVDADCFVTEKYKTLTGSKKDRYVSYYLYDSAAPLPFPHFKNIERIGPSPEEFDKIFAPEFYSIIARAGKNVKQDYIFYITGINLLISVYIAWKMGNIEEGIKTIQEYLQLVSQR